MTDAGPNRTRGWLRPPKPPLVKRPSGGSDWVHPVALALALTLLGSLKPMVVDETIYARYAEHIAEHPGDPYGFEIFWYDQPEPAHEVIVPPLLPYWLAAARAVFGESPPLWKASLFPFALAFSAALAWLLRRLALRHATALLWMIGLSPGVLTSVNLMLSIPTLGLALAAVAAFIAACDRDRPGLALAAGVLAGLAMQTKYSGVVGLAAIASHALIFRRIGYGALCGLVAVSLFVGWESFMAVRYGESHFLYSAGHVREHYWGSTALLWNLGLASLAGATLSAVGVLALAALGVRTGAVAAAALAVFGVFGALPWLPAARISGTGHSFPDPALPRPELLLFAPLGAIALTLMAAAVWRLVQLRRAERGAVDAGVPANLAPRRREAWRWDAWLISWLALEITSFYLLSPYLAARRLIGLGIVATLVAGRVAALGGRGSGRGVAIAACASAVLGLAFLGAEHADARARRGAAVDVAARAAALRADGRCRELWFAGHWGFGYYARNAGLRPIVAEQSQLAQGDCLVIPRGVQRQRVAVDPERTERIFRADTVSPWPLTTIPSFYVGPVPVRAQPDVQVRVEIYRVLVDHVPALP